MSTPAPVQAAVDTTKRRPTEVITAIVGVIVALGFLTIDEAKVLNETAAGFAVAVGAVAPIVTAFVSRIRGE